MTNPRYTVQSRLNLKKRIRETISNFVEEHFDDKESSDAKHSIAHAFRRFNLSVKDKESNEK
jgi:hypothetical protein